MAFDDFVSYLTNVDICHFVNTSIISLKKSWNESIMHSEWSVQGRNGGCDYDSPTFLSNPQVYFSTNTLFFIEISLSKYKDTNKGAKMLLNLDHYSSLPPPLVTYRYSIKDSSL